MKIRSFLLLGIGSLLAVYACRDLEHLPVVPEVGFSNYDRILSVKGTDSLLRLTFSYLDGDGDLGLNEGDTLPPFHYSPTNKYHYNVYVDYYEKIGGKFVPVTIPFSTDTVRFPYRMQVITPEGKNKAIKGFISMDVPVTPYDVKPDSIKFLMYVIDRQLHQSNYAETPAIALSF